MELVEMSTGSSFCSGLENRKYYRRDPSRWPRGTLYPQKLALTMTTSCDHSVGIVRSRTQATEFSCFCFQQQDWLCTATYTYLSRSSFCHGTWLCEPEDIWKENRTCNGVAIEINSCCCLEVDFFYKEDTAVQMQTYILLWCSASVWNVHINGTSTSRL
jgi:hypothetical protein